YAHDFADAQVEQEHFPANLQGRRYYEPTGRGFEATIRERLAWRDDRRPTTDHRPPGLGVAPSIPHHPQSSVDDTEAQTFAGEESQDIGDDDGAQVRRQAAAANNRPIKAAKGKRG